MVSTQRDTLLLILVAAVLGAGLLDAVVSDAWDFVAVFALGLLLLFGVIAQRTRGRHPVGIRPDLAHWLQLEAGARGETVEALTDRCVAAYRAGLTGGE